MIAVIQFELTGCLGLWNQQAYRQRVVNGYGRVPYLETGGR